MNTRIFLALMFAVSPYSLRAQDTAAAHDTAAEAGGIALNTLQQADTTRPPADFVDVDKEPVVLFSPELAYPELAKKAGIEGKVWVKIWVDRAGMPHDAVILKSDAVILNQSALDAAHKFRFTPASIKGKPVDVWVSIPFRFKLAEVKETPKALRDTVEGEIPRPVMDFLHQVLEGPVPDSARVSALLTEKAQAIAGGYLKSLRQAIEEQRRGKGSIEQPGRKVEFFTYGLADDGKSGYVVARTRGGKNSSPHYHTIVILQTPQGEWKIAHWHTWHSSR